MKLPRWQRAVTASLAFVLLTLGLAACKIRMVRGERPVQFAASEITAREVGLGNVGWTSDEVADLAREELAKRWGWTTTPSADAYPIALEVSVFVLTGEASMEISVHVRGVPENTEGPAPFVTQVSGFVDRAEWESTPEPPLRAMVAQSLAHADGIAGMLFGTDEDLERLFFYSSYTQAAGLHEMHRRDWDGILDSAIDALYVDDAIVRTAALEVLVELGQTDAAEYVAGTIGHDRDNVTRSLDALEALLEQPHIAIDAIARNHEDEAVRAAAAQRLAARAGESR